MGPLLIYDFDGVIADSEVVANAVLAEMVTALGVPTTLEDAYRLYMGKRFRKSSARWNPHSVGRRRRRLRQTVKRERCGAFGKNCGSWMVHAAISMRSRM